MNNKLFARIAAAAISATMLGTAVFATESVVSPAVSKDDTAQTASITFVIGETNISTSTEDQITMMAYLVDAKDAEGNDITTVPAYVDQEIVALDQTAGSTGFTTIPLDFAKLASGKKIAVKLGGSDGTVDEYLISYDESGEVVKVTHIIGDVNGDGKVNGADRDALKLYVSARNASAKSTVNTNNGAKIGEEINLINPGSSANWIIGDVNGDGKVNGADRDALKLYVSARNASAKTTVNTNNGAQIGTSLEYPEK